MIYRTFCLLFTAFLTLSCSRDASTIESTIYSGTISEVGLAYLSFLAEEEHSPEHVVVLLHPYAFEFSREELILRKGLKDSVIIFHKVPDDNTRVEPNGIMKEQYIKEVLEEYPDSDVFISALGLPHGMDESLWDRFNDNRPWYVIEPSRDWKTVDSTPSSIRLFAYHGDPHNYPINISYDGFPQQWTYEKIMSTFLEYYREK